MSSESQLSIEKDDKEVFGATEVVSDASSLPETEDQTHRSLKVSGIHPCSALDRSNRPLQNRHIQLIGIGGTPRPADLGGLS